LVNKPESAIIHKPVMLSGLENQRFRL